MTFEDLKQDFRNKCNKGICLRKTFKNDKCKKETKQITCFTKWNKQNEKDAKKQSKGDPLWDEVRKKVLNRDKECQIELNISSRIIFFVRKEHHFLYKRLDRFLDCAHIIPRSEAPHLKYDIDNIILIKRFYHSLLDKSLDFVTGKYLKGERERIINLIMHKTGRWPKNYFYEDFKKDKIKV